MISTTYRIGDLETTGLGLTGFLSDSSTPFTTFLWPCTGVTTFLAMRFGCTIVSVVVTTWVGWLIGDGVTGFPLLI